MRFRTLIVAIVVLLTLVVSLSSVQAATFTVINTLDTGAGSLRQAIIDSNANPGMDNISFNIPGAGPHTIQPLSALPTITDPVVIDGYTQPGASPNPNGPGLGLNTILQIELDGTLAGGIAIGLTIAAGNTEVRGLVVNRFDQDGIELNTEGNNKIEGNFIGTDVTGTIGFGNGSNGISVLSSNNMVGGTAAEAKNLISANFSQGIKIGGSENLVQGNLIGADVTGTTELGNANGIVISGGSNNKIGGTTPDARNVISGNNGDGVVIFSATGNLVQGNFIGTDVTGNTGLGNAARGVKISSALGNTIGGTTPGARNVISANGGHGVAIGGLGNNLVQSNSIFSNGGLGIDLGNDGVTPNDVGDSDTGSNDLQNFPVINSALSNGGTHVSGTLNSTPNTVLRLEFFSNAACDPSGHGEGEKFLGSTDATTDGGGDAVFAIAFPTTVPVGQFMTATATDPDGNTSEFSECLEVQPSPVGGITSFFTEGSNPSANTIALAGMAAAAFAVLGVVGWFARRRRQGA